MFAKGTKPREELSDGTEQKSVTSEEMSEGSLTPALYPRCISLLYDSSVDGSGTRISTAPPPPPGAPSQRSNGCSTLSSRAVMAEGLCLFNSGYLNWARKPTHTSDLYIVAETLSSFGIIIFR